MWMFKASTRVPEDASFVMIVTGMACVASMLWLTLCVLHVPVVS